MHNFVGHIWVDDSVEKPVEEHVVHQNRQRDHADHDIEVGIMSDHVLRHHEHVGSEEFRDPLHTGVNEEPDDVHNEGNDGRDCGPPPDLGVVREEYGPVVHVNDEAGVANGAEGVIIACADCFQPGKREHSDKKEHQGMQQRHGQREKCLFWVQVLRLRTDLVEPGPSEYFLFLKVLILATRRKDWQCAEGIEGETDPVFIDRSARKA
mmetsp:Transcript_8891/g.21274  ORF Transcript_8891/g.21274 Transcript_8891/m.21274 type:complete len:208 (-) Transcript_8891:2734-3357(-)